MAQLNDEARGANHVFTVDLASQSVTAPSGATFKFDIDPGRKQKLLEGLDDIGLTLKRDDAIASFEQRQALSAPWRIRA